MGGVGFGFGFGFGFGYGRGAPQSVPEIQILDVDVDVDILPSHHIWMTHRHPPICRFGTRRPKSGSGLWPR